MGGVYNIVNLHLYHYAANNPVKYIDPDGRIVLTVGPSGSASLLGGVQGSVGFAVGFSWKDGLSIGLYASGGVTVSSVPEPSANGGITFGVTPNAQTVKDIKGSSTGGGIGMNSFGGISLDRTSDNNENGTYSVTFNIRGEALPVPIELHVTHSETFVIGDTVSNIVNEIKNNMIELGREIKNDFDNFVFDHYIVPILDNGL